MQSANKSRKALRLALAALALTVGGLATVGAAQAGGWKYCYWSYGKHICV
jgi:hypothetical protein